MYLPSSKYSVSYNDSNFDPRVFSPSPSPSSDPNSRDHSRHSVQPPSHSNSFLAGFLSCLYLLQAQEKIRERVTAAAV